MVNKILLVFLLQDVLFLASGGLLIGVVFVTKAAMANQPTTNNVAANMLLMQTPLTGMPTFLGLLRQRLIFLSCRRHCRRCTDFRHLPRLLAWGCSILQPYLVQDNCGYDRTDRIAHTHYWRRYLVLHITDSSKPRGNMGTAITAVAKLNTAKGWATYKRKAGEHQLMKSSSNAADISVTLSSKITPARVPFRRLNLATVLVPLATSPIASLTLSSLPYSGLPVSDPCVNFPFLLLTKSKGPILLSSFP